MTERLWFHLETSSKRSNVLQTSETAKNWTERSPKSRLRQINTKLNSAPWNEAKELRNLINRREYRQFQKKLWMSFTLCDGKLWPQTLEYFDNYIQKLTTTSTVITQTSGSLTNLWTYISSWNNPSNSPSNNPGNSSLWENIDMGQITNASDQMKINHAEREYLSKYESLSEAEYNRIFSWKEELAQWQLGICYLVSGIIELADTSYFDTLMRTSITRVQFKDDGSLWYNIRIPLWEPSGRDILIKDSELNMASIRWNIGYKLLELAYVKNRRKNDRNWNRYAPVSRREMLWAQWWWTKEVLDTFLWKQNISFNTFWDQYRARPLQTMSQNNKTQLTWFLRNYNPDIGNKFVSLSSLWWGSDSDSYRVWGKTMYHSHAYALSSVDKDANWNITHVNVKNPWNTDYRAWGSDLSFTLPEFFSAFSYVWAWRIRTDRFLNMT